MANGISSDVDPYGFERSGDFDHSSYNEFMSTYLRVLARRSSKWSSYVGGKRSVKKSRKLKRYVRKGIPSEYRPKVWMTVSGAEAKRRSNPNVYETLLQGPHDSDLLDGINTDLHRTFPDNIYFKNTPSDPQAKRGSLFNVLVAISHKNKEIGYCQGLNFVAGLLLLILKEEEKVFWLLDTLINSILPDYYSKSMVAVRAEQEVFGELVRLKDPEVHSFLEKAGVSWPIVTTRWFICLYIDCMPTETVLRVWDCLLYEGTKILFRVGLTIIKLCREKILTCDNLPQILDAFKAFSADPALVNCHDFMQDVFKIPKPLSMKTIRQMRLHYTELVIAEDEEFEKKRSAVVNSTTK